MLLFSRTTRMMYLEVFGHSVKEIADATGYTTDGIYLARQSDVNHSKVTGVLIMGYEKPLQSRPSQGYLIANVQRISYRPGGPDHVLNLPAPPRLPVSAGAGALFSPPAPPRVQLAVGVASRLWRPG